MVLSGGVVCALLIFFLRASQLPTTRLRATRCLKSRVQVSSESFNLCVLARVQVRILIANHFFLAKSGKGTLQDKRASPTKKSSVSTKEDVPAGMHHGDARVG